MDMTTFMQAMSNPQQYIMGQFMNQMVKEHPAEWSKCQQMFNNKDHNQQVATLRKLYESKGMNLDAIAKQYGVQL